MGYYALTETTAIQYAKEHGYFERKQMYFVMKLEMEI